MPIYEYTCEACGHEFEKLAKMSAAAPPCPECGQDQSRKRISRTSFHLKGGGWYGDHYGLKKTPGPTPDRGSGPASGMGKSGSKTTGSGDGGTAKAASPKSASSDSSGSSKPSEGSSE